MTNPVIELCSGRVMHARLRPFIHRFVYRVFCIRLRIDRLPDAARLNSWLFGIEKRRLVSFFSRDHGARDGSELQSWLASVLTQAQIDIKTGAVWLQCFPRVFGYVFNPVSFWFVHDRDAVLRVLVAEVNNTFGQRHQYVLIAPGLAEITNATELTCTKIFHVSPFCPVSGGYRFRIANHAGLQRMAIDYHDPIEVAEPLLRTAIVTNRKPFSTAALLRHVITMPMMTFGVMLRIHVQAFKLWRKGGRYHSVPPLPESEVTTSDVGGRG
ncbi:MAG: DUF1365 domain-containing protein [Betaproteobacteria bacterium]